MSPEEKSLLADFLRKEFAAISSGHEAKWVFEEIEELDYCTAQETAESILQRRKKSEPLAYILGHWEFRRLRLKVGAGVLIPRPETEELVGHVLDYLKSKTNAKVADLGAGSGAIAISLCEENKDVEVFAVEKSKDAFVFLNENAKVLSVDAQKRLHVIASDWQDAELPELDVIVSNPPYVSAEEYALLDHGVRSFEPKVALVPHNERDPMSDYWAILDLAKRKLKRGGALFFEFGPAQEALWEPLMADFSYKIFKDLSGKPRFLYAFDFAPKSR